MSVIKIEIYENILKVILKSTKKFPEGENYFYTDNTKLARQLVENYSWYLSKHGKNIYVVANIHTDVGWKTLCFHKEYRELLDNILADYIDHINGVGIDNRNCNLNTVNQQKNTRNKPSIGYQIGCNNCFIPNYKLDGKTYNRGSYKTEPEALLAINSIRQQVFNDYDYNFYLDRRDFKAILTQELEGILSHEEATYIRIKTLVENNPWYAYRYNLFDYCSSNSISIPSFELDNEGFMISPVTKERLCPY